MSTESEKYMQRALGLAEKGRGYVSPNPLVGAVIVKDRHILGEGYHAKYGEAHAEVAAIREAKGDAKDSTIYVSLEPCCHHGKTPPCTKAIIDAGIARVVMAMEDPNPLVAGKGRSELESAGIEVELGILEGQARKLNEAFVKHTITGMPFIVAKAAMTLDGKIATQTGDSKWITNEESRGYVHWMRAGVDAVMVGSGTAEADDPQLTTRTGDNNGRDAIRIIIDGDARVSPESRVFRLQSSVPTIVIVKKDAAEERKSALADAGAELIEIEPKNDKIDLVKMAKALGDRKIASVMIEGGGGLLAAAFDAGIVDKALFFIAPKIFGGRHAPTAVEGTGARMVSEAVHLRDISTHRFGDDIMIEGYVIK